MWTQDPASVLAAGAQPKATMQFGEEPRGVFRKMGLEHGTHPQHLVSQVSPAAEALASWAGRVGQGLSSSLSVCLLGDQNFRE